MRKGGARSISRRLSAQPATAGAAMAAARPLVLPRPSAREVCRLRHM